MSAPDHSGFYMWCASEDVQTAGYWSFDPPTGGGNPSTRFIAFVPGTEPPKNYTEPEVQALIAEARRDGWNAGVEAAAALAHPPQWERKGKPGLWRLRRAKIAAAIRALREETP